MEYIKLSRKVLAGIILCLAITACNKTPEVTDGMLDGKVIFDPSLYAPEDYLQSLANPNPTAAEAALPVFIACHGFTASTFEWEEFRTRLSDSSDYYISLVLLGGHGLTYEDFKISDWKGWQQSIKDEYERLVEAGYTNLNFVGSSTSCTLITDLLSTGYFNDKLIPKNILFVDPIVVPSSKIMSLVGIIGGMIGYIEVENVNNEDIYWYHYMPQETLKQLNKVVTLVRKELQDGITLPAGCSLKVYKSTRDATADPVSAVLLYQGMNTNTGGNIEVEMIDSDLHVYTRLDERSDVQTEDVIRRDNTFTDFLNRVK